MASPSPTATTSGSYMSSDKKEQSIAASEASVSASAYEKARAMMLTPPPRRGEHPLLTMLRTRMPAAAVTAERNKEFKAALQRDKTLDDIADIAIDKVENDIELKQMNDHKCNNGNGNGNDGVISKDDHNINGRGGGEFIDRPYVSMVSPMVRYSKLPFRLLCRRWGADIAFTPMIIAVYHHIILH
jgi:hypothetical protein